MQDLEIRPKTWSPHRLSKLTLPSSDIP